MWFCNVLNQRPCHFSFPSSVLSAYDGGDCCSCTCVPTTDNACKLGFACVDPEAACMNDDDITVDMFDNCGWVLSIGNGYCDQDNNNAECGTYVVIPG